MDRIFEGCLLVTDMDGTLLDRDKKISPENREAIARFVAQGGLFTIATGRIAASARSYVEQLPVGVPAILYNGAVIYDFDRNERTWTRALPESALEVVERTVRRFPGIGVEIYEAAKEYPTIAQENEMTAQHQQIESMPFQKADRPGLVAQPWIKVLFAWEPARIDEVAAAVEELTGNADVLWVRSDDKYIELLSTGASKGHALERLMQQLGISRDCCLAMGDHLNDLEMIRRAGVGVAVANAHPELLGAAVHCCKHHQDHAVADAIAWWEARRRSEIRTQ
ncbi:5-amino-6-(5-phospho-D-ribitylamino)uracil phosphatase YcsE [Paenibacillus solanacearum]|uniref:5-amino-6-(5-phospho-D-ribitylamino)uracil phosphatase YcsE n=1 Tax=Paenibacillus solanacearum TaxID=2048548 RepID=A0A916NG48_9BACL|nr:Cof-type HAD-IIB family hydrolase [Paenibacillus solanacearum]CAG7604703.1 5-amino-6-(5-phospho-D-ribitylamino)uracil phosphatase YcsE [Paenibacillus solanacearum]